MKMLRLALLALVCTALIGCASIHPLLESGAEPDPGSGYVAGSFSRNKGDDELAFILRNDDTGKEYGMTLGDESRMSAGADEQVIAIQLPPGRYTLTHWITYAALTKQQLKKNPITSPRLSASFNVAAGSVVYLGNFSIATARSYTYPAVHSNWSIQSVPVSQPDVTRKFAQAYPKLGGLPLSCRLCLAPPAN